MLNRRCAPQVTGVVAIVAAVVACGSSKPAYCSDVSSLKASVQNLSLDGGLSGVQSQLKTIEGQAKTAISAAKSDFPDETSALQSSISGLTSAVDRLPSSASPQDVLGLAPAAASVKSAVTDFGNATGSKC